MSPGSTARRAAPSRRSPRRSRGRSPGARSSGDDPIDETDRGRVVAGDATTRVEQLGGVLASDGGGQRDAQAEAVVESEAGEVGAEPRLGRSDPEVGGHRHPEATTDRRTLDRGDDRLAGPEQPHRGTVQITGRIRGARRREVGARAEVLALGRQHDRPARPIVVERLEGVGELGDHRRGEEVVRWPTQRDGGDVVVGDRHCDERVGHQCRFRSNRSSIAAQWRASALAS